MKKMIAVAGILVALAGCDKVDKNICWSPETKTSVDALVDAQGKDIKPMIQSYFDLRGVEVFFGPVNVNLKKTDFSLEKIDSETGSADCSFALGVEAKYNASAALTGSGRVRFSSRIGEHGRYITISKSDIPPVIAAMK
ncbi:lipoprotein [Pseudomonas sp. K2I15]|uniref:lipoprotein n=1 Tax=unclassified Pseudomonas TaxID=196821 RepID=UPI000B4DC343|nr:lipoprotein [Pseudomonas sp. K2I15]OWP73186.1 hypothetical protein CEC48_04070 [Pseudomonas sp. K2I15]